MAAKHIARGTILSRTTRHTVENGFDRVLLNPWVGPLILFALLFVVFQAVFAWATPFADALEGLVAILSEWAVALLPEGVLRDFVTEGVLAGVGSVVVFLPQIVILFFFILIMEATGYMARAAFLMDRVMASVGLSGKSFIPLLSSFACAIPGIMATRSISDPKDRLTTILIAPLMTCSARLPVYAVIIAAFIPATTVGPGIGLQGLVLFALYVAGIVGAMVVAFVLRFTVAKGAASGFIMEMPRYQMPRIKDLAIGLWQRAWVFLRRAGTIIFVATIALWVLLSFPRAEPGESQLDASYAGAVADTLHPVLEPVGFNREMSLALIPALAAREVAVTALATTYAVDADDATVLAWLDARCPAPSAPRLIFTPTRPVLRLLPPPPRPAPPPPRPAPPPPPLAWLVRARGRRAPAGRWPRRAARSASRPPAPRAAPWAGWPCGRNRSPPGSTANAKAAWRGTPARHIRRPRGPPRRGPARSTRRGCPPPVAPFQAPPWRPQPQALTIALWARVKPYSE